MALALYITHPQIRLDPAIPIPSWGLSDIGRARAGLAASRPWAKSIGRIISSDETKAVETAEFFAKSAGIDFEVVEGMGENDRSSTGFLPPNAFEQAADWFFAHPEESFKGWERACDAQSRIIAAVEGVLAKHDPNVPIAFVGHGGVGTLLKCHLAGRPISRDEDQPAGGGNLIAFDLAERRLTCDWTRMEDWKG